MLQVVICQKVFPQSDYCEKDCCKSGYADCGGAGIPVADIDNLDDEPNNGSDEELMLNTGTLLENVKKKEA
jgi:hypothetical protein